MDTQTRKTTVIQTRQAFEDILNGATIFASGGGGPRAIGQGVIDHILKQGGSVTLAAPDTAIADDASGAVAAGVGAPDAVTGTGIFKAAVNAWAELERRVGKRFDFVLPGEVGAGNSFIPMLIAAARGIPVVDCSGADRAIPTLTQDTYAANDVPIGPMVLANDQGFTLTLDVAWAKDAMSPMRGIVSGPQFQQDAGIAFWPMDGKTMKRVGVKGTLTDAWNLGKALREACESGQDPVAAVTGALGGWELFRGTIQNIQASTSGAFDFDTITIKASQGDAVMTIYGQNENITAWTTAHPQPVGLIPDKITYLTPDGQAFSNAEISQYQGREIVVIGAPARPVMRQPNILPAFLATMRTLGYGGPYVPIERLRAAQTGSAGTV